MPPGPASHEAECAFPIDVDAHAHTLSVYTATQTNTDRKHSTRINTDSTSSLILLPSLSDQDESLLVVWIHPVAGHWIAPVTGIWT